MEHLKTVFTKKTLMRLHVGSLYTIYWLTDGGQIT